ncbi:MAG: SDR family NAD(P)-dependent oxidoreductase [Ignavibacteriaceae bacterium]|nr:SDR family NAD(P)-dependent oxidoreductase [Ignavibacteriaceae bacterium]
MTLENKNIIITGAGRGIGRETAKKLSSYGANLILLSRTEGELKDTLNSLGKNRRDSFYKVLDISKKKDVKDIFGEIIDRIDRIDGLVNNAGIQMPIGPFEKTDIAAWANNLEINLLGTVYCTYNVIQKMIKSRKGKIINLSGGGSTSSRVNFSPYGVAKTAVVRFTETIAEELLPYNIDVNSISPGAINTKMLDDVLAVQERAGGEYKDALKRKAEGGDDPEKAAELIAFLCSDESDGITGKLISAQWDPWQTEEFRMLLKNDKDIGTLRRIDNRNYFKKS